MLLLGFIVTCFLLSITSGFSLWDESHYRPCPDLDPISDLDLTELSGKWHASLTIVDSLGGDHFEESEVCLTGDLMPVTSGSKTMKRDVSDAEPKDEPANATTVHQVWTLHSPSSTDPSAVVHITSRLMRPGVWLLHTPLDGKVKATVYGYDKDKYMAVCGCGWRDGRLVHLWTSAVSRDGSLTSLARQVVGKILDQDTVDQNGTGTRLISWNTRCTPTASSSP